MAKEYTPTIKELKELNSLATRVFSETFGPCGEVELEPFAMPVDITKTQVFPAYVRVSGGDRTVNIPSQVIVKKYIGGVERTSLGTEQEEFTKESAVLHLDIKSRTPWHGDKEVRVYPISYSNGDRECREKKIIIREFIPGKTLEQLAETQKTSLGHLLWEGPYGTQVLSEFTLPLAILHTKSPMIAEQLNNQGLLRSGTPEEAKPKEITENMAMRYVRYLGKLISGEGAEIDKGDTMKVGKAIYNLHSKLVSRKYLLSVVNGELDGFPHHAMLNRIPDAGGVEVDGFIRDLAVYGSPCFSSLWERPEGMPVTVFETYKNVRLQIEDNLKVREGLKEILEKVDEGEIRLGLLFSAVLGSIKKAAVVVHYRGKKNDPSVGPEVSTHLNNASAYLRSFREILPEIGAYRRDADILMNFMKKYSLDSDVYVPVNEKVKSSNYKTRRSFLSAKNIPRDRKTLKINQRRIELA